VYVCVAPPSAAFGGLFCVQNNAKQILRLEAEHENGFVGWLWSFAPTSDEERLVASENIPSTHMRTDFKTKSSERTVSDGAANSLSISICQRSSLMQKLSVCAGVHATVSVGKLSAALKKENFKFVGETTTLSFMEAVGLVNHHRPECFVFEELEGAK
jgi:3-methyladenine DNA glycosylase Tag